MLISTNVKLQITKMVPLLTRTNWVGVGDRERERERNRSGKDRGREKKGARDGESCENR